MALGLTAGALSLFATPARAIEKIPFYAPNGSGTVFFGTDATGDLYRGSERVGKAPFHVNAITSALTAGNAYPITCTFTWGDGSANVSVLSSPTSGAIVNGVVLPNMCAAFHTYNAAGNYVAYVNTSDAAGAYRVDHYRVIVYSSVYPGSSYRVFLEGQGKVANLTRQTYASQPIVAFLYNNGTAPLAGGVTFSWFMDSWSNLTYTDTTNKMIFPDSYFPSVWPGNVPQVITAPGTHHVWVRAVNGATNVTSPHMTVVYVASVVQPSMTVTEKYNVLSNVQPGQVVLNPITITNSGSMTVAWTDATTQSGTQPGYVFLANEPGTLYNSLGPVTNNSVQTYVLMQSVNGSAIYENPSPMGGLGVLLQPGETITLTQELYYPSGFPNLATSGQVTTTFQPYAAGSCTSVGVCSVAGQQVIGIVQATTGGPAPPSITTNYGQQIGNGSVLLSGTVNSMGTATLMQTWFQFTVPNGSTYTTSTQMVTQIGVVQYYLYGAPVGNYSARFLATTSTGLNLDGGLVTFTVGINSPSSNPAGTGQGFTQGFLYGIANAAGMPAIFVGMVIGFGLILALIILPLVFITTAFGVELPFFVWTSAILIGVVMCVIFWLWPSWVLLLILIPEALAVWSEFNSGGSEAAGGE